MKHTLAIWPNYASFYTDKIVDLGAKQIFVSRDMKVVFQNNVVAGVQ